MAALPGRNQSRGAFIAVEGLDRAGKSSQCELLRNSLATSGHCVEYIRFPDRTTAIGKLIDSYLRGQSDLEDHSIHLLFSANRWEVAKTIQDNIDNGVLVIVDRYSYSGAVYSAAKANPSLSLDWAWQPEVGLPQPDICIFLSISPEEAAKRGGFGFEKYENIALQSRVCDLFYTLFDLRPEDDIHVLDGGRPVDQVSDDILKAVSKCVARLNDIGPLRKFKHILSRPRQA